MDEALKDERFSHILKDPRFRKIPKHVKKIKVDKRFNTMFKDRDFTQKCRLDERGRPVDLAPSENLKKLYNVTADSSEDDESDEEVEITVEKSKFNKTHSEKEAKELEKVQCSSGKSPLEKEESDASVEDEYIASDKTEKKVQERVQKNKKTPKKETKSSKMSKPLVDGDRSLKKDSKETSLQDERDLEKKKLESKSKLSKIKKTAILEDSDEDISSDATEDQSESSSDEDDSESEESEAEKEDEFDHRWEELNADAPDTDEVTRRLAVCNMDWDRIRADDLFAVFDSFKPADGCIQSVKIYPSEFGQKRMEEEKLNGPSELVEEVLEINDEEDNDEDAKNKKGSKYHREKLRQYQLNRLKYYYAVVECDSPTTANTLCEELNGMEYENSSVRFDLRFIPDDVTFDQEPTSIADKTPDPTEYKPRVFVTTALQQVKVNLTWDETDPKRRETLQKAFTEPETIERDIRDYLASSSGESEEEEETEIADESDVKMSTKARIEKYKALLQSLEEKEKNTEEKFEMEITWEPGLKEKTQEIVKEKLLNDSSTPFEEMLKKKKEDRKMKQKEKKQPNAVDPEDSSESEDGSPEDENSKRQENKDKKKVDELYLISDTKKIQEPNSEQYKKKKKKNKLEKSDQFKCNVQDPRFSAIYSSHLYNIDPSDPHFKKTEGNMAIIKEKQDRLKHKLPDSSSQNKRKKLKLC